MANSTVLSISPDFLLLDTYSVSDENLISNQEITSTFNPGSDYVEYYIYGLNNSLLYPSLEDGTVPYSLYSLLDNELSIDPSSDLQAYGFEQGSYNVLYNFYSNKLASSFNTQYFISEISSDRTELRLDSNDIEDANIISSVTDFIIERAADEFYPDFLLNFGSNRTVIANNITLDGNTVLIKLYEPLPQQFGLKSTLWVVEEVAEPIAYNITFEEEVLEAIDTSIQIKGPNYNLNIKDQINNSTEAVSLSELDTSPLTSSYHQLQSLFQEEGLQINVDYTEYSNFILNSSIEARLENFEYKLQLIESYRESSKEGSNVSNTTAVSGSKVYYENLINETIKNFDGYEHFLYFESGSKSWPKSNSKPPYQNLATTNINAINWYNEQIASASLFDELNLNSNYYDVPEYLRNDPSNQGYIDFVNMIGQHFDNIWIYLKDISNKYNADNRINAGISKDLVAQTLRDFSLKIYQNNFSSKDIYSSFLGLTPSGSLFPFPEMTGSLPTPSGFEYIDTFISSSTDAIPLDDVNKRIYKRLYHNLPYLLKSKGTIQGLKTLLNIYGIPDTILRISEFGGKDKINENDWDYYYRKFNYALDTKGTNYVTTPFIVNPDWNSFNGHDVPEAVQLRFKTRGIPTDAGYYSQSVFTTDQEVTLRLRYTGSGYSVGSFDGATTDPYNEYAHLEFIPDSTTPNNSASIFLPFFDEDWWSVMICVSESVDYLSNSVYHYNVWAADKIYNGVTGTEIGFIASSSVSSSSTSWIDSSNAYYSDDSNTVLGGKMFSGSLQEIRYFNVCVSESRFRDYVLNPLSFEGNPFLKYKSGLQRHIESSSINVAPEELIFRAALGSELDTGSRMSIHPKVTGSWINVPSFTGGSSIFDIINDYIDDVRFEENREYIFFDNPAVGIKNRINDKIRSKDLSLPIYNLTRGAIIPNENTLSNQRSIQQDKLEDNQYTNNIDLLEVTFSPQNEINDDIIGQIGHFNIGNLIGDPREKFTTNKRYPDLHKLNQDYFLKYIHENYDFNDYVRLIKFFDNSLFKMIKDFIPAKTSLASGITIKQHILERQKYPEPQPIWTRHEYTGSIGQIPGLLSGSRIYTASTEYESFPLYNFSGGTGGSLEPFNTARGYFSGSVGNGSLSYFVNGTTFKNFFALNSAITNSTLNLNNPEIFEYDSTKKFFKNISGIPVRFDLELIAIRSGASPGYLLFRLADEYGNPISKTYNTKDYPNPPFPDSIPAYFYGITIPKNGYFQIQVAEDLPFGLGVGIDDLVFKFNFNNLPADTAGEVWEEIIPTKVGNLTQSFQSEEQLYNGEFKGSTIDVIENNLLDNPYLLPQTQGNLYDIIIISGDSVKNQNINPGEIYIAVAGGKVYSIGIHPRDKVGQSHSFSLQNFINISLTLSNGIFTIPYKIKPYEIGLTPTNAYYYQYNGVVTSVIPSLGTQTDVETFFDPPSYAGINFYNSDFNPIINNTLDNRLSTRRYDVDYSSGNLVAVNYQSIMSGSALKAPLQDYNYDSLSSARPRYIGSRNSSDAVNSGLTTTAKNLQSTYNQSFQPATDKLPVVEQLNAAAYGINYGGGTSPEILGLGGTSLNNIYIAGNSKDAINIIPPSDLNYSTTINTSLEYGDVISLYQYKATSANIPTKLEVVSTDIAVPPISSYMVPSTQGVGYATFFSSDNSFKFNIGVGGGVYRVGRNSSGNYVDANFLGASVFLEEFENQFNSSPDDWYVSIYSILDSPVVYNGSTATKPYQFSLISSPEDPFGPYGVAKITNILNDSVTPEYKIYLNRDLSSLNGFEIGDDYGILIWQSQGNSIIVKNSTLPGVEQGLIYSQYAPTTLTENLDYISKTYANNSN